MLKYFFDGLINLIYPPACIVCRRPVSSFALDFQLCSACQRSVMLSTPPFCAKCSRPLAHPLALLCPLCLKSDHCYNRMYAASLYNDTMKRMLHLLKYGHKTGLKCFFFFLLQTYIETFRIDLSRFDVLIPVPLHPVRLRERGFNQSLLIAELISQEFHLPIHDKAIQRIRHTPNQARLSQKERWTNTKGAFKIKQPTIINKKNILIIDDLYTTGATISELARVLKDCGAHDVSGLTVAIAMEKKEDMSS